MSEATQQRVIVRPAILNRYTATPVTQATRKRVAAYARVSTDDEEQQTSYAAQVDYYTKYIQDNKDWDFAGMYTDEGISATSTRKRDGFNSMVHDALEGRIDLIITKSVSRFARNTVDSLTTVRLLKDKGVEVYFEKENIYTLDSKGELLITIMSSLAQEESRSISENVAWGMHKRFADGKVSMSYKHFLGYCKGKNGQPEIVPEEAEVVRLIYRLFLEGKTPFMIGKILAREGIRSPAGKEVWQTATIRSILTNEKYKGDAILQKTFCTDFLTKKFKRNEGELPQYYVQDSHPAIVTAEEYDMVQQEFALRQKTGRHSGLTCFSGKLVCGCCGGYYGSKVWHSNDKYRRVIWQCNGKYKNAQKCETPHLDEQTIQALFIKAVNSLITDKQFIAEDTELIIAMLTDTTALDKEKTALTSELAVVAGLMERLIADNARMVQDQAEYQSKYTELSERYTKCEARLDEVTKERNERHIKGNAIREFLARLMSLDAPVTNFTESLWSALVDRATVAADGKVTFLFRNGTTIEQ